MANWAALQEKLIDKPVFKRARHGIHFKDGKSILANFSGKPCHYFDGKLWKPIDTKLIAIGTEYGAPGLKPRIKTDGTVRIDGTEYNQRSTRIGIFDPTTRSFTAIKTIPLGNLDGDKLIAESGIWRRELRLTEDGLREEIVIASKPTNTGADLNDWLVLETQVTGVTFPDGWLSDFKVSEFKFPTPSAHDAEGNEADCKRYARTVNGKQYIYTGVPATWLVDAVYPVVIDPDFTIATGVGADNYMRSTSISSNYGTADDIRVGADGTYVGVMRFDLSSVSGETTSAATLVLTFETDETSDTYNIYKITDANGDWAETDCTWRRKSESLSTAWAGSSGLSTAGTDYIDTVIATVTAAGTANNTLSIVFNSSGYAVLDDWFGDATNNGFKLVATGSDLRYLQSKDDLTEAYRPVLSITYGAAAASLHTLSLLGVGK